MSWIHKTAVEQHAALQRGEISSVNLLEETIVHTEQLRPYINPIALPLYDRARKAAIAADKQLARKKGGPLCGIPVTIKDSQWLAGVPCANGSITLKNFIPTETSQSVQRLEQAGAVIFAKTTCPEYSLSGITNSALYGLTSNPWDLRKTPGGSSGGAAAAVAAGMGSLSLGGDGGGSIRIPAAFCGITGFKPSFGAVPRAPGFTTWESLVAYGPMTRSVEDAQLMYSVLADSALPPEQTSGLAEQPIKCIVSEDLGFAPIDLDVKAAFNVAITKIIEAGHNVKYGNPGLSSSVVPWVVTATYDMWKQKSKDRKKAAVRSVMGRHTKGFIDFGGSFNELDFEDAQLQRTRIYDAYMELFRLQQADLLITPTLGCEAFPHGTTYPLTIGSKAIEYPWLDWAGFLYDANLAGLPACSIPMGYGDEGLPLSLQIVGPPGHDLQVLNAARSFEKLLAWQHPEFRLANYSQLELPQNTNLLVA